MASDKSTLRPLRTFRLVCQKEEIPQVEALLMEQGYRFDPEPFSPWVRRLVEEPKPLGASLAAFFGLIYIQDRSSMLPPLALAPQEGDAVLDMCASPGSKTGFLAQMVGPEGFVLGNEPSRNRLATLRQNLFNLNLIQAATCSYSGEQLALPSGMWDLIQLDPPCSGWGTVERNPKVLDLWQGDKIKPLIALQRQLLREAMRLLKAGGKVVFSTCTTNVEENEGQVRFAVDELGFELVPLEPVAGFSFAKPMLEGCEGVWRVDPQGEQLAQDTQDGGSCEDTGEHNGQGFFVAALRKPNTAQDCTPQVDSEEFCPETHAEERRARVNAHKKHYPDSFMPMQAAPVHPRDLDQAGVDATLLPSGQVSVFGESARFLPAKALELLPAGFKWQGCALGKAAQRGDIRVFPRLRCLMPLADDAHTTGALAVNVDDINEITRLLTGQSLTIDINTDIQNKKVMNKYKEACLYWRGLRLCRLRLKGNGNTVRAMWSER